MARRTTKQTHSAWGGLMFAIKGSVALVGTIPMALAEVDKQTDRWEITRAVKRDPIGKLMVGRGEAQQIASKRLNDLIDSLEF